MDERRTLEGAGLLFTDLEASTIHLRNLGHDFPSALSRHNELIRAAAREEGGSEVGSEGDSISLVFPTASAAVRAAVAAQKAIRMEPWPDSPWRVRMCVHVGRVELTEAGAVGIALHEAARIRNVAHGGQVLLSEQAQSAAAAAGGHARDLGLHEIRDIDGRVRVYQLVTQELEESFPPLRTSHRVDVPRALSSYIERSEDLSSLIAATTTNRLVTVVGPGGAGKTRLAFEAARTGTIPEAVAVELAPLRSTAPVLVVVARAVGAGDPETIGDAIADRSMLLVLDNCEHLLATITPLVSDLLRRCSQLKVLATSREPLGIRGEVIWPIPPLGRDAAQRLFRARAPAGLDLDETMVARICHLLEGHPLAVELAAGRLRSLALADLDRLLIDQLTVLTGGSLEVPRHQTMRASIAWSYELLSGSESASLRQLSVFAGGFNLEAAQYLLRDATTATVPEDLDSLTQRSLLEFDPTHARYRLLEPVRQYAAEQLAAADEELATLDRHLSWTVSLCGHANRMMYVDQSTWTQVLDRESDNIGAAVEHALTTDDLTAATRIVSSLSWYWFTARRGDGTVWTSKVLERVEDMDDLSAGRALLAAGIVHCDAFRDRRAVQWLSQAAGHFRALGHDRGLATALFWSGRALAGRGDNRAAFEAFDEAGRLYERVNDVFGSCWCVIWGATLGVAVGEDLDTAENRLVEVVERAREAELDHVMAGAIGELAIVAMHRRDEAAALKHLDKALGLYTALGDRWQVGIALERRGWLLATSDRVGAAMDLAAAIAVFESLRAESNLARVVAQAAALLHEAGSIEEAEALIEAVRHRTEPHYLTGPALLSRRPVNPPPSDPTITVRSAGVEASRLLGLLCVGAERSSPPPPIAAHIAPGTLEAPTP